MTPTIGTTDTVLNRWLRANGSALGGAWTGKLDILSAGAIVVGALVVLAAIPATSKFALYAALGVLFLLIVTGSVRKA